MINIFVQLPSALFGNVILLLLSRSVSNLFVQMQTRSVFVQMQFLSVG
jgi:hypothetical protein